jgi:hypothetical protein
MLIKNMLEDLGGGDLESAIPIPNVSMPPPRFGFLSDRLLTLSQRSTSLS